MNNLKLEVFFVLLPYDQKITPLKTKYLRDLFFPISLPEGKDLSRLNKLTGKKCTKMTGLLTIITMHIIFIFL